MDGSDEIAAADRAMRHWQGAPGEVRLGTDAHRQLFCRMLLETHNPYRPAVIPWPALAPDDLRRLTALPIWNLAVQTEGRAAATVAAYVPSVGDELLRRALDMNGGEEGRHKEVLSRLVAAYGIALAPEPAYPPPADPTGAWIKLGYSESVDSFFAFGLFEMARRSGYFPPALVETFEPVIQEEARHILFFANWVAWYRRQLSWWRRIGFAFTVAAAWFRLIRERMALAGDLGPKAKGSGGGGSKFGPGMSARAFIDLCLSENEHRMAGYDGRLLRPTAVPRLARLARRFVS